MVEGIDPIRNGCVLMVNVFRSVREPMEEGRVPLRLLADITMAVTPPVVESTVTPYHAETSVGEDAFTDVVQPVEMVQYVAPPAAT